MSDLVLGANDFEQKSLSVGSKNSVGVLLEKLFTVITLFLLSGALMPLMRGQDSIVVDYQIEGDPVAQLLWSALYLTAFILLLPRWKNVLGFAIKEKWLLLLIVLSFLSFFWSGEPALTLRRSVAVFGTTLFGVYLAERYTLSEWLKLLAWSLGISALLSMFTALFLPSLGIMYHFGEPVWQGIFSHKNALGRIMAFAVLTFVLLPVASKYFVFKYFGIGLTLFLIFKANSAGALVLVSTVFCLIPLLRVLRGNPNIVISFIFFGIITFAGFLVVALDPGIDYLLNVLGRDYMLTGRVKLWSYVWDAIQGRLFFGYGFSAFWLGSTSEAHVIWSRLLWQTPHAHNGFLDLWLQLGLVGLIIYLSGFLKW